MDINDKSPRIWFEYLIDILDDGPDRLGHPEIETLTNKAMLIARGCKQANCPEEDVKGWSAVHIFLDAACAEYTSETSSCGGWRYAAEELYQKLKIVHWLVKKLDKDFTAVATIKHPEQMA